MTLTYQTLWAKWDVKSPIELSQFKEADVDKYLITPRQIITFFFKLKIHQSTNPSISL